METDNDAVPDNAQCEWLPSYIEEEVLIIIHHELNLAKMNH